MQVDPLNYFKRNVRLKKSIYKKGETDKINIQENLTEEIVTSKMIPWVEIIPRSCDPVQIKQAKGET